VFLNDVFISVQSFLDTERGEIGHTLRNEAAERELQTFLQTEIAGLPAETRLAALSGVRDASRTLGEGGLPLFTAVDVNSRSFGKLGFDPAAFDSRLGLLEQNAVTVQQLADARVQIVDTALAELAPVRGAQTQLAQHLELKADRQAVDTLERDAATLRRELDTLSAGTGSLRTDLGELSASFKGLDTKLARDLGAVGIRLDDIDEKLRRR
jgi:hypothetical protein